MLMLYFAACVAFDEIAYLLVGKLLFITLIGYYIIYSHKMHLFLKKIIVSLYQRVFPLLLEHGIFLK